MGAALYTRISKDDAGTGLGVARQEREMREVLAAKGIEVSAVYSDNDVSASKYSKKARRQYAEMVEAMKRGEFDAVAVWDLDRLCRRPQEQEDFYVLAESAGMRRLVLRTEDYDLGGSLVLPRVKAAIAAEESRKTSERVKSKHREWLANGEPCPGVRPFGLSDIRTGPDGRTFREVVPAEAEALRQAARDILEGKALWAICRGLSAAGFRGTLGAELGTPVQLTRMLTAQWIVGKRQGNPAQWPAILDEDSSVRSPLFLTPASAPGGSTRPTS